MWESDGINLTWSPSRVFHPDILHIKSSRSHKGRVGSLLSHNLKTTWAIAGLYPLKDGEREACSYGQQFRTVEPFAPDPVHG